MDLSDRAGLVTGASSGIGRATAEALAAEGVRAGLAARREAALTDIADGIEADGGEAIVVPTDVRDEAQVESMVETTVDAFGGLDVLVNNAGVGHSEPIGDADPVEWRREMEVNLLELMTATRLGVAAKRERGSGHVVNVSSLSGRFPGPDNPGYAASKFGVKGFTQSVFYDVREDGIRVMLVEPGEVDTRLQSDEVREAVRILDPEDVADAIIYAVSRPEHVCVRDLEVGPAGHE